MNNTIKFRVFNSLIKKYLFLTSLVLISIISSISAQTVPCNQRVIDNANFTYTGPGVAPARWNINQADTGNAHLDQTAFSYVASGNFANVATNFNGSGTNNTNRQYAVVANPNTLSPQYANIPTDGMLVINPLQGQNDQYLTYTLGGLVPGNTYNIEIKVWNVLDLAYPGACQSWCNWNDQLFIDMQNNQAGAEHSNQTAQNWTGTNGSGAWSQGTNQVNNILKVSSGGAYAIITGSMTMPASGNTLTITLAKGNSSNAVVLGVDYIKVYGCQQEAINITGGTPNVCEASQFTLTAQGIGPAGSTYQWYHNGTLISGSTSDTLNIVSGIVPGVNDIYKAVGQWDTISTTLVPKLCCSSVDGTSDEVFRQSFNGLTYTCTASTYGPYANIPGIGVSSFIDPSYTYAGVGCNNLDNGQYAIVQNSYAGQFWKNRPEVFDHTGVAGSGALFVNAIGGVGQDFFKTTLSGLCNNTTYDFSIWYASLAATGEIKPYIEFDVLQGATNVATTNTGVIPINEQWYEADVTFTTPATGNPTYTLQAVNLVSGTSGNDLMLDDIVVKKCTPSINLYENGTTDSVVSVCDNNPVDITVNTFYSLPLEITGSTTGTVYYQWMSATSPTGPWTLLGTPETTGTYSATPTATTTYYRAKVSASSASAATGTVPVATDCGNDAMTNSFSLTKGGNFSIPPITGTTAYCIGNTMTLTGNPGTGAQWEWRKGNTSTAATPISGYTYSSTVANEIFTKTFAITDTGNYYFFAKTADGCESYSTVNVTANPLPTITTALTASGTCISSSVQTSSLAYTTTTVSPTNYAITWNAAGITAGLVNVASTALPPSPISLDVPANTAAGTYTGTIVVTNAGACASTGTTFTLTVNSLPSIATATTAGSVCISSSAQTSNLAYTTTTASPTNYTITWNAAGITAGLVNVASTALPSSPISINVPANTAAGTYIGTITVTNAGGCAGSGTTFTLTVNPKLAVAIDCGNPTNSSVQFNWGPVGTETGYTVSHTINNGPSISDGSITATTFSVSSLNAGDSVTITVTPTGGANCFAPTIFACKATTCPILTPQTPTSDIAVCNNIPENFTENGTAGLEFTWTNSNAAIGLGASNSTGTNPLTISFTTTNTGSSDITGRIRIAGTIGVCTYQVDSFNITVHPDAIVTLTSIAGSDAQTVCINKAISNITYSITGTGNSASVSGLPNGVTGAYNAGVFTISGTPTQTGTFNYTITGTGTCGNGTAAGLITVTALPVISNITPTNPSSCGGSDGSFTISGLTASSSYTVNFIKDGTPQTAQILTSDGSGNVMVASLQQGTYTGITVTTAGGCVSNAVPTTLSDPSVFNPIASSNSPCVGSTLNLASTTSPDPTATYSWTGPVSYAATGATPSISNVTTSMNGDYTVKATVSGCTSSSTVTVKINSAPSAPAGTDGAVCGTGSVTLDVIPSAGTDALAWYSDATLTTQVASGTSYTTPLLNNDTSYYVTETNTSSCTSTATVVKATINQVPLAPTGTDGARCGTGTVNLGATSSSGATDILKWYSDAGLTLQVATGTSFTTQSLSVPATDYYVTETSPANCTSTSATPVIATINASPTVQFEPFGPVCQEAAAFALTTGSEVSGPLGSGRYTGNGVSGDSLFTPQQAGPGTSTLTYTYTANGCFDTAMQTISVYPTPSVDYGGTQSILEGDSATLSQVSVTGIGLQYLWVPAAFLNTDTSATPVCKPVADITYTITATSPGGCHASASLLVQVLKDFVVPNTFTPNNDGINDTWVIEELPKYPIQWVQVFDRYGQLLYESHGYSTPWDGTYKGHPLAAGTYYYIIELNGLIAPKTGYVTILR